jgi:signal transduction histidine kinase/CheY-like chemotaxis protein
LRDFQLEKQKSQFRTVLLSGLIVAGAIVFSLLLFGFLSIRRSRNEVRGANAVLTDVNAKLEKALKAKTEFLATTSHEIRTPLNGILGMTQILLANRKIEGEVREQVEVVHGAGETMRALVDDILDVAKMETGEVSLVRETVSLKQILADAARLWSGHASGKGLALEVEIDGAPEHILSDATRVRQIVFNLLSNAIKFTRHGHVGLKAYVERRASGEELVVEISDTGLGIPEEDQERIFEAFHQVDGGTTRQFSGTGLGLAICRNLADALGGSIALLSRVGTGSTFTLRLPFERTGHLEMPAQERSTARPGALGEASVVLLESNGLAQGAIRSLLEPIVGSLDCVANSRAALLALRTWRVDHLLIEARSAEIDGLNPIGSLRALVEEAGTFGVLTTILCAPSEELPLTELLQVGASQVVMKPVSGTRLVAVLAEAYAAIERPSDDRAAPIASAA